MILGPRQTSAAISSAVIVISFICIPSSPGAESLNAKPLTPEQEALWEAQEELYDRQEAIEPAEYPNYIDRLQNLLKKQEIAFGHDSPQVSCTLDQLYSMYRLQKKPDLEIAAAKRSLEIKRKILGPQAVDTAMATCHLAISFVAAKKFDEAISALKDFLNQLEPTPTHSAEAMIVYEIGRTYFEWNKFEQAQPWFDKAVSLKAQFAPNTKVYPSYNKAMAGRAANLQMLARSK